MTRDNIMPDEDIFGHNLGSLKINTKIRLSSEAAASRLTIPPEIKEQYKNITISIGIIFTNNFALMMTVSKNRRYIIADYIPSRRKDVIISATKRTKNTYS